MSFKFCGIFILLIVVCAVKVQSSCPAAFRPPTECFPIDEIKDYGPTSTSIESLYNNYVDLMTDARLTIEGDEVCAKSKKVVMKTSKFNFLAWRRLFLRRRIVSKSKKVEILRKLDYYIPGGGIAPRLSRAWFNGTAVSLLPEAIQRHS